MKKILSYPFPLVSGLVLVIILIATSTFALDADPDEGIGNIEDPRVLAPSFDMINPTCLDNYDQWPRSQQFNPDAEWSLAAVPASLDEYGVVEHPTRQFIDLNGDGLLDFVYSFKHTLPEDKNVTYDCLMLHNGHGWDVVYRCVTAHVEDLGNAFLGDCALIE